MKTLLNVLVILLVLMVSVITFYSFNLVFSFVSNYASLSRTSFSFIPMLAFNFVLIVLMFGAFNFFIIKRRDPYFIRKYSLIVAIASFIGFVMSIVCGTYVYGSFIKDFVFNAYPLIMLIVHLLVLGIALYYFINSHLKIVKEKPERTFVAPKLFALREIALGAIVTFALERLGAFVLIPVYFSDVDGAYTIPVLIQLLVPTLIFVTFIIHEHFLHNRKVTIVLSSIAFGYTVLSLIYLLVISHGRYPLMTNPLSPIMQLERLVVYPVGAIVLYGFSLIVSGLNLGNNIVMSIKEKRKSK